MNNVTKIVALLRKQAELEQTIANANTAPAVGAEQELEHTRRRLTAHPQALRALLRTTRALRRAPDFHPARLTIAASHAVESGPER